jgi:hypothetical protein
MLFACHVCPGNTNWVSLFCDASFSNWVDMVK